MLPESRDKDPGTPICFPKTPQGPIFTGACDCRSSRKNAACAHFSRLVRMASEIRKRHGDLVYLREMNILAELEVPGAGRRFTSPVSMRLEKTWL